MAALDARIDRITLEVAAQFHLKLRRDYSSLQAPRELISCQNILKSIFHLALQAVAGFLQQTYESFFGGEPRGSFLVESRLN